MSEKLYGWAFVILPKWEDLQCSRAIISWVEKSDITIHEHTKVSFSNLQELRWQVASFVQSIIELQPRWIKIPVSCGIANSLDATLLLWWFWDRWFRKVWSWKTKQLIASIPELEVLRLQNNLSREQWDQLRGELSKKLTFSALWDLFKSGNHFSKRLQVDKRWYGTADERDILDIGRDMRLMFSELLIGTELMDDIFHFLADEDILKWKKSPTWEMKEKVSELAKRYAGIFQDQLSKRHIGGEYINRFINIGDENDIRNIIFIVPELRQIFSEVFLSELGFQHNVCIKPTWAKPSPPFGDVVATFLADMMDKRDGTRPSTASINYWEEYT